MPIRRTIAVIVIGLLVLIGGTFVAVDFTADYLLYKDATSTARTWARHVGDHVADLQHIAGGETPSSASMAFFRWTQRVGDVFRYEIFNREGFSQLISERGNVELVGLSEFSAAAAQAAKTGEPIVTVKEGTSADQPAFFAQAHVPVVAGGRVIAVVTAYVDQTGRREQFRVAWLSAALSLCSLIGVAFGVPAIAWHRRTKEKQRADARLRFLAHNDEMTGLLNRARLSDELHRVLARQPERGQRVAVHYIDLDRFKEINDTFGLLGGDMLLKTVAARLREATSDTDLIARLGGDEFVVVQCEIESEVEAERLAQRLLADIAKPVLIDGHEVVTNCSIGIAIAPDHGFDPVRLLKSADIALYKSKADGRNCARQFTPEMDAELQARLTLEKSVRDAAAHEGFELHYQPVFEMAGDRLVAFEALLRLQGADGSSIAPAVFIPLAEQMGLIGRVGAWVLRAACRTAQTWPDHLKIAVNLSPAQFETGDVYEDVAAALRESGLQPSRLELEITESLLLRETDAVIDKLSKLKELGVAIVMDDFGTGYSSLSYLWRFPFDKIKIDRSFMGGLDTDHKHVDTIVRTIVWLGRSLQMQVTVEGVESSRQVAFARDVCCDEVQGFFFGRPMPVADVASAIRSALPAFPVAAWTARTSSSSRIPEARHCRQLLQSHGAAIRSGAFLQLSSSDA